MRCLHYTVTHILNPFMPNDFPPQYQLDLVRIYFELKGCWVDSNFESTFCKQTVEALIRPRVLRRLIWVCTVCLCSTKRTLGLNGLRKIVFHSMYFTLYCGNSLLPYHKGLLLKERINSLPEGELILFLSEAPNFEKGHNG